MYETRPFAILFDLILIPLVLYLVFTQQWFAGGFGWFLLLGLSPSAHRI
jgi:hypothetical protein